MSSIELFEFPDFQGDPCYIYQDIADLKSKDFLKKASSLKVRGDPWIVFTGVDYKGEFKCYKEGKHNSIPEFDNKISSVRHVKGGLGNPKITLHEHVQYGGKSLTLEKAADSLHPIGFPNMSSSHKVTRGAWVLFTKENYQGDHMVTVKGDEVPGYSAFTGNDKVKSLRPVQA